MKLAQVEASGSNYFGSRRRKRLHSANLAEMLQMKLSKINKNSRNVEFRKRTGQKARSGAVARKFYRRQKRNRREKSGHFEKQNGGQQNGQNFE